jgi:hypothetical protein
LNWSRLKNTRAGAFLIWSVRGVCSHINSLVKIFRTAIPHAFRRVRSLSSSNLAKAKTRSDGSFATDHLQFPGLVSITDVALRRNPFDVDKCNKCREQEVAVEKVGFPEKSPKSGDRKYTSRLLAKCYQRLAGCNPRFGPDLGATLKQSTRTINASIGNYFVSR